MYQITDSILKSGVYSALTEPTREFQQRLSFGEGMGESFIKQISFEKGITKVEISQEGNSDGNGIVFGSCCASSCAAEFYNPDKTYNYNGKTLFAECGIKLADDSFFYIPCGYYKVEKPETDDDWRTVKITAYDAVDDMTEPWNTNVSFPSNAYVLLENTVEKHNLVLDVESDVLNELRKRTVTQAEAEILTAYTEREVCGFLCGLVAANARINTVGKFSVRRYQYFPAEDFTIQPEVQWQNGFTKTAEEEFVIHSVTSGVDDKVFTAGTGPGISFVNPIITEDEITELYDMYTGLSFQPSSCEWRGNPCVECGDTVYVRDKNGNIYTVFVASQEIDLTGGLSMQTNCPGGDAEISFDTVDERTRKALNKQYTALQQAIVDASNAINGALGGHYEILDSDNDGYPDGWLIKQYQDGTGGLIRANYAGIGLSSDGGKTYRLAITHKGINADYIVTGKLRADLIDTSKLVVGGGSYENLEGLLNGVVDTANSSITKVDVLYGKNQSTTAPPTSWSTSAPVWQNGYYIWTKTQTTAGGEVTETEPVCITGAKGSTGATGADGLGIKKIEEQYYLSTSSSSVTGGSWSTNQPEWAENKYIWTRNKVTWDDNTVTYTTAVLAKAINGANESANASKLILDAVTAQENNVTVIKGSSIATGSIGAVQIAAESITADKLSVGLSKRENLFYNPEFTESYTKDGVKVSAGWAVKNGQITVNNGYVSVFPATSDGRVGITQKVWLKPGVYSIVAQINLYKPHQVLTNAKIGYFIGDNSPYDNTVQILGNTALLNINKERVVKYVITYDGEEGLVDVGLYFTGYISNYSFNIAWMALFNADEEQTNNNFYCSDPALLKPNYKTSNLLTYYNYPSAYIHAVPSFNVNSDGSFDVISGRLGCVDFSRSSLVFESNMYDTYSDSSVNTTMQINVPSGTTVASSYIGTTLFEKTYKAVPSIFIESQNFTNTYSYLSLTGFECRSGSYISTIKPTQVSSSEFKNLSKEKYKKDIVEKSSVINSFKASKIYDYRYKSDSSENKKMGFVIERETPTEIISDDGEGINLYSMASMNWKATQEILERLEAVEKEVKTNA